MFVLIDYFIAYNNSIKKSGGVFMKIQVPKNTYQIKIKILSQTEG